MGNRRRNRRFGIRCLHLVSSGLERGHDDIVPQGDRARPHRSDAYAGCRYAIERIKQIAPIWKREFFEGGDVWIEGATANPDDARARAEAERVACA